MVMDCRGGRRCSGRWIGCDCVCGETFDGDRVARDAAHRRPGRRESGASMKSLLLATIAACAFAQSGLEVPRLGMMLDRGGALRPVVGVAASVTLGDAVFRDAVSFACGHERCLVKTSTAVVEGDRSTDAPAGAALFAIDRGTVLVYFTETKRLARWSAGTLDPMEVEIDGEVLCLRAASGGSDFAKRRAAGLSMGRFHLADGTSG